MKKLTLNTRIRFLKYQSFGFGVLFALTKQRWFFERKISAGIVLLSLINLLSACDNKPSKQLGTTSKPRQQKSATTVIEKPQPKPIVEVTCYFQAPFSPDSTKAQSSDSIMPAQKNSIDEHPMPSEYFFIVDEMPRFAEGDVKDYISKHLIYPQDALKKRIEGRVITQIIIDSTGCISNVQVVRSVDPELDAEAVRIMQSMPKWIPGKQGNKPVRVKYTMPVTFRLPQETK